MKMDQQGKGSGALILGIAALIGLAFLSRNGEEPTPGPTRGNLIVQGTPTLVLQGDAGQLPVPGALVVKGQPSLVLQKQ